MEVNGDQRLELRAVLAAERLEDGTHDADVSVTFHDGLL
jgi:hypothetical protein